MNRVVISFLALIITFSAMANNSYWRNVRDMRRGVKIKELSLTEPRMMKAWMVRVDLKTSGIGFVTTERADEWGEDMPDYTNKVMKIHTERERTIDFMSRKRSEGKKVEIAVNTSPWAPWCSPWTHKWGNLNRWAVSHGVELCAGKPSAKGAFFVVKKNGRAAIVDCVDPALRNKVAHVHPGFTIIATNGVAIAEKEVSLHPRTALGLSRDARYLYLLVVDGRQPKRSLGASLSDLSKMLLEAGASDAMNMDGGGSTSLVVYDSAKKAPRMLNSHRKGAIRKVAMNLGIVFK